jgi:integrase
VLDEGIDPRKAAIVKRASPRTESPAAHAPGAASHAVSAQPPIGSAAHAISKVVRRPTDLSDDPERPKDAHSALFLAHEFYHRHVFMYGIHRATVPDSPVKLMYRPGGTETPAERALSETEPKSFLLNCQNVCRTRRSGHVLMTLLLTMQRRQELALAKKAEFDLEKRTWSIPDEHAKKGRGHVLPLSDWAVEEIRSLMGISRASSYLCSPKRSEKGRLPDSRCQPRALSRHSRLYLPCRSICPIIGFSARSFGSCRAHSVSLWAYRLILKTGSHFAVTRLWRQSRSLSSHTVRRCKWIAEH